MSKKYSRESGSLFPDSLLELNDFKDIDDSVKDVMTNYYKYVHAGNIDAALSLKNEHPELEDYWVNASKLNLMKEEIQNIGMFATMLRGTVISNEEPELDYDTGSYWIQPVG